MIKTATVFPNISRILAPAQRAVGDCSPLKESPGRAPAAGDFFFNYWSKFIENYHYFVIFCDILWYLPMYFGWQSWKTLNVQNIFEKYVKNHQKIFDKKKFKKKKKRKVEKKWQKKIFIFPPDFNTIWGHGATIIFRNYNRLYSNS